MNAATDENGVKTLLGTLDSDGQTTIKIKVNPGALTLRMSNGTTGTASSRVSAPRDQNHHPALMGVSSADMKTPIPIATDINGNILVTTT